MVTSRINTEQLVANCQGDQESAVLRLESFCDRGMKLIDLIEISITDRNWQDVNQLAGRIHGTLKNISADPVAQLAKALELQSQQNECRAFEDLQKETTAMLLEIEAYLDQVANGR